MDRERDEVNILASVYDNGVSRRILKIIENFI